MWSFACGVAPSIEYWGAELVFLLVTKRIQSIGWPGDYTLGGISLSFEIHSMKI